MVIDFEATESKSHNSECVVFDLAGRQTAGGDSEKESEREREDREIQVQTHLFP